MANVLVAYDTKHGQTAKIAERIAATLASRGHTCDVRRVADVTHVELERADAIVLGGPIYILSTSKPLRRLLAREQSTLASRPTFLFTVCMSEAGHADKPKQDVRRIVAEMLTKTGLHPEATTVFAGAIKYTEYNFLVRWIMKRISAAEGSNTDTSRDWEYTDWTKVDAFATTVADRIEPARATESAAQ